MRPSQKLLALGMFLLAALGVAVTVVKAGETSITPDQARIALGVTVNRMVQEQTVGSTPSATYVLPAGFHPNVQDPTNQGPLNNLAVYRNGLLQGQGNDYTYNMTTTTITFTPVVPQTGDILQFVSFQ